MNAARRFIKYREVLRAKLYQIPLFIVNSEWFGAQCVYIMKS